MLERGKSTMDFTPIDYLLLIALYSVPTRSPPFEHDVS